MPKANTLETILAAGVMAYLPSAKRTETTRNIYKNVCGHWLGHWTSIGKQDMFMERCGNLHLYIAIIYMVVSLVWLSWLTHCLTLLYGSDCSSCLHKIACQKQTNKKKNKGYSKINKWRKSTKLNNLNENEMTTIWIVQCAWAFAFAIRNSHFALIGQQTLCFDKFVDFTQSEQQQHRQHMYLKANARFVFSLVTITVSALVFCFCISAALFSFNCN